MIRFAVPIIAATVLAAPAFADHHQAALMKQITGVWRIEEGKNQGEKLTGEELRGRVIIAEKTIVTYDNEEKELYRATFTVNADADPVQITMTATQNGQKLKALGILKHEEENNAFWLCYGLPGSPRPTKFESPGGSKNMLFELQRQKIDANDAAAKSNPQ